MMEVLRVFGMMCLFNSFLILVFIGLVTVLILEKVGVIQYDDEE